MTDPEVDPETVRAVADRYSIDVADPETAAADVEGSAALLSDLSGPDRQSHPAADVRPGDDEYNAFLFRCRLDGDGGPLSGLRVAVKDNVAVSGVKVTCGSAALEHVPAYSATVVERLTAAGADLVGTTNMDEFAYSPSGETSAHGPVENPTVAGAVPGGSSAGSGAAVAAGLVDVAIGTDTAGSVRIPASYCGVVGLKPTRRAVSRFGVADLAPSLDSVGPIAGSVETAARTFDAVAGPDPRDPTTRDRPAPERVAPAVEDGVEEMRLGLVEEALTVADPGVREAVETAADRLADRGATVERTTLPGHGDAALALAAVVGAEFAALVSPSGLPAADTGDGGLRAAVGRAVREGPVGEYVREQVQTHATLAEASGGEVYARASGAREAFATRVRDRFERFDALLGPTTPATAPPSGSVTDDADVLRSIAATAPVNLAGVPALSVPCGRVGGAPVGLQAVGAPYDERTAVRVGAAVERRRED